MGRATGGVIGMRLADDDRVLAVGLASEGEEMISVTEQGYGKRSKLSDYPPKGRGGKGVIGHQLTDKTGLLAGAYIGSKDIDMFVISSSGQVVRVPRRARSAGSGRASQGVRTMRVEDDATVVALAPVIIQMDEDDEDRGPDTERGAPLAPLAGSPSDRRGSADGHQQIVGIDRCAVARVPLEVVVRRGRVPRRAHVADDVAGLHRAQLAVGRQVGVVHVVPPRRRPRPPGRPGRSGLATALPSNGATIGVPVAADHVVALMDVVRRARHVADVTEVVRDLDGTAHRAPLQWQRLDPVGELCALLHAGRSPARGSTSRPRAPPPHGAVDGLELLLLPVLEAAVHSDLGLRGGFERS